MITEYGFLPGRSGVDLTDRDSPAGKAMQHCLDVVLRQPGALRGYWSPEIENPSNARVFADWESLDAHVKFTQSEDFHPMAEVLAAHFDMERGSIKHVSLDPSPPTPYLPRPGDGVTEVFNAWFPADYSAAEKAAVSTAYQGFVDGALKTSPDFRGSCAGWSVETDMPVPDSDVTGSLFVAFIVWPSVDAHMKFRDTEPFKEHVSILRELPRKIKLGMFHVSCSTKEGICS